MALSIVGATSLLVDYAYSSNFIGIHTMTDFLTDSLNYLSDKTNDIISWFGDIFDRSRIEEYKSHMEMNRFENQSEMKIKPME